MTGLKTVIVMVANMRVITREMGIVLLEIEDKAEVISKVLCMVKVEEVVDLIKSPNVRCPRVVSKTVDKDKMRCQYCNEFGHFIRECSKRNRDEEEARCFSDMNSDYYENEGYDDVYDEDYDDEVFATLNN